MSNAEIIGMLRLELTETLGRLGEVERLNQLLLESHRRVYLATKPVLDAVAHWCETEDNTEEGGSASATLFDAYQAYNPPREFEVYKCAVDDRVAIDNGRALVHAWWANGRGAYTLSHKGPAALAKLCDLAERLMWENAESQEWGERCQKVAHERGAIIDKMHEREHKLKEELARLKKSQDGLLSLAIEEFSR